MSGNDGFFGSDGSPEDHFRGTGDPALWLTTLRWQDEPPPESSDDDMEGSREESSVASPSEHQASPIAPEEGSEDAEVAVPPLVNAELLPEESIEEAQVESPMPDASTEAALFAPAAIVIPEMTAGNRISQPFLSFSSLQQTQLERSGSQAGKLSGITNASFHHAKPTLLSPDRTHHWYTEEGHRLLRPIYGGDDPKWTLWPQSRTPRQNLVMSDRPYFKPVAIRAMYDLYSQDINNAYLSSDIAISKDFLDENGNPGHNGDRRQQILRDLGCELIAGSLLGYLANPATLEAAQKTKIRELTKRDTAAGQSLYEAISLCLTRIPGTIKSLLEDMYNADLAAYRRWVENYQESYAGMGKLRLWSVSKGSRNSRLVSAPIHAYTSYLKCHQVPPAHPQATVEPELIPATISPTAGLPETPQGEFSAAETLEQKLQKWRRDAESLGFFEEEGEPSMHGQGSSS